MGDSKQIEPGDLVVVIKDCCGFDLGSFRTASRIGRLSDAPCILKCHRCDQIVGNEIFVWDDSIQNGTWAAKVFPIEWLQKIRPPGKTVVTQEPGEIVA